jgi:hypothetical protein
MSRQGSNNSQIAAFTQLLNSHTATLRPVGATARADNGRLGPAQLDASTLRVGTDPAAAGAALAWLGKGWPEVRPRPPPTASRLPPCRGAELA